MKSVFRASALLSVIAVFSALTLPRLEENRVFGQTILSHFPSAQRLGWSTATDGTAAADIFIGRTAAKELSIGNATALTSPIFTLNQATSSAVTGLSLTSAAAAGGFNMGVLSSGTNENLTVNAKGAGTITLGNTSTGALVLGRASGVTGTLTITSNGAASLAVGRQGATSPAFVVDASTGTSVTGFQVKAAASGGGLALSAVGGATDESLTLDSKGAGTITLGGTSTGAITLSRATGVTGALTVTSAGSAALAVGRQGATSPALVVNASAGTSVTGLSVTAGASGGGLGVAVVGGATDENLTVNAKGAGTTTIAGTSTGNVISRAVTIGPSTLTGGSATSNFLNVTGTLPSSLSAATNGIYTSITSAGSSGQIVRAFQNELKAGYTGANYTFGITTENFAAGTGTNAWNGGAANYGAYFDAQAATAGYNVGFFAQALSSTGANFGVISNAISSGNNAVNVGTFANSYNANSATGTTYCGGYFGNVSSQPTFPNAALVSNNGTTTNPIYLGQDNGSTVFTIADGGLVTSTSTVKAVGLSATGDNSGIASTVSMTNATDTTTTNAYTVKGGQVATTANTGWLKLYNGTAVIWIPYWQNATP